MRTTATVLLIENSTAGNSPRKFEAQVVEVTHEEDTVIQGIDGHISRASRPSKVVWFNGRASSLRNITHITITGNNGNTLIDGELNIFHEMPQDIDNDVVFYVLAQN